MKRILSVFILMAVLLSCVPASVLAIDRENTENIAQKNYTEDEPVFYTSYESLSISSGAPDRWNGMYPRTKVEAIVDPTDSTNKVGCFLSPGSTATKQYLVAQEGKPFAFSTDIYIPTCTDGVSYPSAVYVKLSKTVILTMTYSTQSGLYTWTIGSKSGTVAPETWFHLSCVATPSTTGGFLQSTATIQISGNLKNSSGTAISSAKATGVALQYDNSTTSTACLQVYTTVPTNASGEKIPGGFYLDDTRFYIPGDLYKANVETDSYGDPAGNVDLNGKVKITFNHDLDMSSLDLSKVRLYTSADESVPYTSLTFDKANPRVLTFSFEEDTLTTYTTYYVNIGDTVRDLGGNVIKTPVISFDTKGQKDSRPAPEAIIEAPEGGYVMPDRYNTGYRCDESELEDFTAKYGITPRSDTNVAEITEDLARKFNYEFSHFKTTASLKITATSPVYIHDFKIESGSINNSGSARLTVAWGEGKDTGFGGANLTLSHIYAYDISADHMKGDSNQIIESCYFRDGGTRTPGAHADVIQISCSTTEVTNSIKIIGNRFDAPHLAYDHVSNACIFLKPENWSGQASQGHANIQISYNWFNGGGYTTYLEANGNSVDRLNYLTYSYNTIGYGYVFGTLNHKGWEKSDFTYEGNAMVTRLVAGSVVYYDGEGNRVYDASSLSGNGKVVVNFANYMTEERDYKIVVDAVDVNGNVVKSYVTQDSVFRYTPPSEYYVKDNLEPLLDANGKPVYAEGKVVEYLKEVPVLPHDVPGEVELTDLPDMSTHTLEVRVYDTTVGTKFLRSSELGDTVSENTLEAKEFSEKFTVTFVDKDGNVLKTELVEMGDPATAPEAPALEGYVHTGWSTTFSCVIKNQTVKALYEKLYTVTFLDKDGTVIESQSVINGNAAIAPEAPAVDGYTFTGWSEDISMVKADMTVTALYTKETTIADFESAVEVLVTLQGVSLAKRYTALCTAALTLAGIENKDSVYQTEAYASYVAFISAYNEDVKEISSDIHKPY